MSMPNRIHRTPRARRGFKSGVMGAGSGGSAMLALKAGPMRRHDYTTLFKLEHMLKDVRLCLEEGQAAGCKERLPSGRTQMESGAERRSRISWFPECLQASTTLQQS